MIVPSLLKEFSVDPNVVKDAGQMADVFEKFEEVTQQYIKDMHFVAEHEIFDSLMRLYTLEHQGLITIRIYKKGLITFNMEYVQKEPDHRLMPYIANRFYEGDLLKNIPSIKDIHSLTPIKRGSFMGYYDYGDDYLVEIQCEKILFHEKSPYQIVKIVKTKPFGNMLLLDGLPNLSEADLVYTESLIRRGIEDYKDKEILILGGGDGALVYELLKESPKHVIMIEIDETVMRACNEHMRSVCGDVLEKRSGPNYEIIVGDCLKYLDKYKKEGKKFDYVFGDLTDIPLCGENCNSELMQLFENCLRKSFSVLKPNGKYMTHVCGRGDTIIINKFVSEVKKIDQSIIFNSSSVFVPSFHEDWLFYQLSIPNKSLEKNNFN